MEKRKVYSAAVRKMSRVFEVGYDKNIRIAERINAVKASKIYTQGFQNATEFYLEKNSFEDVPILESAQFNSLFVDIYKSTGLRFARWWSNNFKRFSAKFKEPDYETIWQVYFAQYGQTQAGLKVVTVQRTMKDVFIKRLRRLFADTDFQSLGAEEKSRILRRRGFWSKESRYMALRLARTESNAAANLGIEQSSLSLFGSQDLLKRWATAGDERVRDTHRVVGMSKAIPFDAYFQVGSVRMKRPSDMEAIGSGKEVAKEVINCRCRLEVIPNPRNTISDFDTIPDLRGVDRVFQDYFDAAALGLTFFEEEGVNQ